MSVNGSILPFLPSFPHLSDLSVMSCSNVGRTRVEMTMFEIVDCITEIARTVLYASLVQYLTQPFIEEGNTLFFALFCRYIHVVDPGYL